MKTQDFVNLIRLNDLNKHSGRDQGQGRAVTVGSMYRVAYIETDSLECMHT